MASSTAPMSSIYPLLLGKWSRRTTFFFSLSLEGENKQSLEAIWKVMQRSCHPFQIKSRGVHVEKRKRMSCCGTTRWENDDLIKET